MGKKIKLFLSCVSVGVAVCASAMISACDTGNDGHIHVSETYLISETEHWRICDDCGETFSKAAHDMNGGVCSVCGYYDNYTEGLEFSEIYDENEKLTSYSVSGIGTATDTDLRIPYFYNSLPVTFIEEAAFKDCTNLTSVVIPDSVKDTGFYAFQNCTNITSVDTGNGLYQITFCVFDGCEKLTDLNIGNGVKIMGEWAFRNCTGLTEILLPDSLTDLNGGALDGCANLEYNEYENVLYLGSKTNPYFALTKVQDKKADSIVINEGTRFIIGDFSGCTNITELVIPEGVLSFARSAFSNCTKLAQITLPESLTSIGGAAFQNCTSLASVTIGANVKSIGIDAFSGCTKLESAVFVNPDGWYSKTMLNVETRTEITEDLSDPAAAATCLKTTYVKVFMLHD